MDPSEPPLPMPDLFPLEFAPSDEGLSYSESQLHKGTLIFVLNQQKYCHMRAIHYPRLLREMITLLISNTFVSKLADGINLQKVRPAKPTTDAEYEREARLRPDRKRAAKQADRVLALFGHLASKAPDGDLPLAVKLWLSSISARFLDVAFNIKEGEIVHDSSDLREANQQDIRSAETISVPHEAGSDLRESDIKRDVISASEVIDDKRPLTSTEIPHRSAGAVAGTFEFANPAGAVPIIPMSPAPLLDSYLDGLGVIPHAVLDFISSMPDVRLPSLTPSVGDAVLGGPLLLPPAAQLLRPTEGSSASNVQPQRTNDQLSVVLSDYLPATFPASQDDWSRLVARPGLTDQAMYQRPFPDFAGPSLNADVCGNLDVYGALPPAVAYPASYPYGPKASTAAFPADGRGVLAGMPMPCPRTFPAPVTSQQSAGWASRSSIGGTYGDMTGYPLAGPSEVDFSTAQFDGEGERRSIPFDPREGLWGPTPLGYCSSGPPSTYPPTAAFGSVPGSSHPSATLPSTHVDSAPVYSLGSEPVNKVRRKKRKKKATKRNPPVGGSPPGYPPPDPAAIGPLTGDVTGIPLIDLSALRVFAPPAWAEQLCASEPGMAMKRHADDAFPDDGEEAQRRDQMFRRLAQVSFNIARRTVMEEAEYDEY